MKLSILYRGPLSSCNYGCEYCPFAKHAETAREREADARALGRFVSWVGGRQRDALSVFFTPWGEALIHRRYQQAIVRLTNFPHVRKVAIQTNLSCRLDWVEECDKRRLALWTTFHPSEVARARFVEKCVDLDRRGVRFSVGVVGLREHFDEITSLRKELPPHVYLWINAYKRFEGYYDAADLQLLETVDPQFPVNNRRHPSLGRSCRCGASVVSVDGDGNMRRCHFIPTPIGNIYEQGFESALGEMPCTNETCGCHIGYVHMDELGLYEVYGEGVLERIPAEPLWRRRPLPVLI